MLHVAVWHMHRPQSSGMVTPLRPKHIPYMSHSFMHTRAVLQEDVGFYIGTILGPFGEVASLPPGWPHRAKQMRSAGRPPTWAPTQAGA